MKPISERILFNQTKQFNNEVPQKKSSKPDLLNFKETEPKPIRQYSRNLNNSFLLNRYIQQPSENLISVFIFVQTESSVYFVLDSLKPALYCKVFYYIQPLSIFLEKLVHHPRFTTINMHK